MPHKETLVNFTKLSWANILSQFIALISEKLYIASILEKFVPIVSFDRAHKIQGSLEANIKFDYKAIEELALNNFKIIPRLSHHASNQRIHKDKFLIISICSFGFYLGQRVSIDWIAINIWAIQLKKMALGRLSFCFKQINASLFSLETHPANNF
jgi:hypothetical protein